MGRGGRGGGGSSGGGRSFSSGGGRSFSGRSSNSSRGGFSGGSSSSRGGFNNNSSSNNKNGNIFFRPTYYSPRRTYYSGGAPANNQNSTQTTGVFTTVIILIIAIFIFAVIIFGVFDGGGGMSIPKSTIAREALAKGNVVETGYLTDELNWINNKTNLAKSMKYFYQKTGVQPYLYITDTVNGKTNPTEVDAEIFANDTYDKLFEDEGHILIIFHESVPSEYSIWQLSGKQAKTVMDDEAVDILLSYIESNYYSDMSDDELFATAFEKSADRIMKVTKSPFLIIITLMLVLAIAVIAYFWWTKAKKQKNIEAKQMEDVLNTPLETFGDDEASELAKKYEKNEQQ